MNAIAELPLRMPNPTISGSATATNKAIWGPHFEVPLAGTDNFSLGTPGNQGVNYLNAFGNEYSVTDVSADSSLGADESTEET